MYQISFRTSDNTFLNRGQEESLRSFLCQSDSRLRRKIPESNVELFIRTFTKGYSNGHTAVERVKAVWRSYQDAPEYYTQDLAELATRLFGQGSIFQRDVEYPKTTIETRK